MSAAKLTPEVHRTIVAALRAFQPQEVAAATAGVHARTLREWLTRGRRETSGPYRELADAVGLAGRQAEGLALNAIVTAASGGDTRAAQWLLEHTRSGYHQVVELRAQARGEIVEEILTRLASRMLPDAYDAVVEALCEGDGGDDDAGSDERSDHGEGSRDASEADTDIEH